MYYSLLTFAFGATLAMWGGTPIGPRDQMWGGNSNWTKRAMPGGTPDCPGAQSKMKPVVLAKRSDAELVEELGKAKG